MKGKAISEWVQNCSQVYIGKDACMSRLRSTIGIYGFQELKPLTVSENAEKTGHYPFWDEDKIIDRDPHWYSWRVKEAIHIRLNPNLLNWDRYHCGPPREQFRPLMIPTMPRIINSTKNVWGLLSTEFFIILHIIQKPNSIIVIHYFCPKYF